MSEDSENVESVSEDVEGLEFYTDAAKYWDKVPPTVDGMLGGFGFISNTDIEGSQGFLKIIFKMKNAPEKNYALDCGSGIGRITKNLLTKHFKKVDLVEQSSKFLEAAKVSLASCSSRIGEFYPQGLQDFSPAPEKYDVIWCQWVLGHLKDADLIQFFKKCIPALRNKGVLVVKENVTSSDKLEIDTQDSSVTRPLTELKKCFEKAGLICLSEQVQHRLPKGLFPVYMFALRAAKPMDQG
ncbi:N-terminal Xaa-Pro-Lys N-methyltransferase 1 [Venturia canescens]|uniref:N-terminal Xaa-Pro-Lys N-methyltransferase 1 n=1 Tax=Venturia canescens TaxID=32260 RepID=UPI001C9BE640|nr:N-terminal Xaa-Pro-Lys N-methyltransferase 1 [Venturia canescens]XP_043275525.1 N-terminal Xaa-Pro-Lys N-methyltransferase 1 [Venturia canescens]XP_043275526.1 N-terminal Xaa-Pro-Lys N-methyltransferase 1 [Venturia canescens]